MYCRYAAGTSRLLLAQVRHMGEIARSIIGAISHSEGKGLWGRVLGKGLWIQPSFCSLPTCRHLIGPMASRK